jgi:hypothetical protein
MNTEELREPDSSKYPKGYLEKITADPEQKKTKKQPQGK